MPKVATAADIFPEEAFTPEEQAIFDGMMKGGPVEDTIEGGEETAEGAADTLEGAASEDTAEGAAGDDTAAAAVEEKQPSAQEKGRAKMVPHGALHAEREERKRIQSERDKALEEKAKYEERFNLFMEALKPEEAKKEAAPAPINPDEDFLGAIKQQAAEIERLKTQRVEDAKASTTQAEEQQAASRYTSDLKAADAKDPNFKSAAQFVVKSLDAQLIAQGVKEPAKRVQMIQQQERVFYKGAYAAGENPADRLVAYAKSVGWSAPTAKVAGATTGTAPAKNAVDDAIAAIDRIAKGPGASLSGAGGGSTAEPTTLKTVAAMDDDQFAEFVGKMGGIKEFNRRFLGA